MVRRIFVLSIALWGCGNGDDQTSTAERAVVTCSALPASADAFIANPPMRWSFGQLPILNTGGFAQTLIRFDMSSIPSSAVVESSTLQLYAAANIWWGSFLRLHRATAPWTENVTFASFAQKFDPQVIAASQIDGTGLKSIDLKTQTERWISGQDNNGLLIESNWYQKTIFVSREGGTAAQQPKLVVCYSVPVDHCAPNPCEHEGTCQNGSDSFTCQCPVGYEGTRCETEIDNCASNPCQNNGTCSSDFGGFTCECPTGFTGAACETNIDECANAPCLNGGVCEDGIAGYLCHCPPGYEGANCETLVEHCSPNPCANGGTCTNELNGYTCSCPVGYTGPNCEVDIDDCANAPCNNGGTCIDEINGFSCSCPVDWGGDLCDVNLNSCALEPCLNNGACTNAPGSYTCTCASGYTGTNCEVDIDDCAAAPCLNGGLCVDGVASYTCQCGPGFEGTNCETVVPITTDLSVSITGPATAVQGEVVTLTVSVTNHSLTTTATNPRVTINRDRIVLSQATIPGGSCVIGSNLSCLPGPLPPGATKTFTVSGASTLSSVGPATNIASVTPTVGTIDPVSTNNSSTVVVTIFGANLALTMTGPGQVSGSPFQFSYQIDVSNLGPGPSTNAIVTDLLPAVFPANSATVVSSRGSCGITRQGPRDQVQCILGAMTVNDTATITVSLDILTALLGTVVNTASVTSASGDNVATNNSASVTTVFSALP